MAHWLPLNRTRCADTVCWYLQPFSQKPRTPTVAPLCQIGLCDPVKADLKEWCYSWRARFLRERLCTHTERLCTYSRFVKNLARQLLHHSDKSAFTGSQRSICESGATVCVRGFSENGCRVRSRYKRQLIRLNMNKKWLTRTGMEDSRPIFFCKRFSDNENALYEVPEFFFLCK